MSGTSKKLFIQKLCDLKFVCHVTVWLISVFAIFCTISKLLNYISVLRINKSYIIHWNITTGQYVHLLQGQIFRIFVFNFWTLPFLNVSLAPFWKGKKKTFPSGHSLEPWSVPSFMFETKANADMDSRYRVQACSGFNSLQKYMLIFILHGNSSHQ